MNEIAQLEMNVDYVGKLRQLESYEIIFVCDDSGSMAAVLKEGNDPFGKQQTRWDEVGWAFMNSLTFCILFGIDVHNVIGGC